MLGPRPLHVAPYEQVKLDEAQMKILKKDGKKEDQKRVGSLPKVTHNYHVADRVLVLQPGIRPVPLKWESPVQDTGPQETSQLHIISNGESSPRDLHLKAKTQLHSTTSKLQCGTPYAKQLARQEHSPTH